MKIIVAVIGFFATATSAFAQFEPLQFAICKKIAADSERLKCFDAVGNAPSAQPGQAEESKPIKGKWVYTESKSPVDDSPQLLAVLASDLTDAVLVFRCREKKTETMFWPRSYFFASGRAEVLMRINSDPPETLSWSVGTNNKSLFVSPAPAFMILLPDNGKLFLRAIGFQGKQTDATFSLADVSAARSPSR